MKKFYRIAFALLINLTLVSALFAQRTTYRLKFNGTNTDDDLLFGWNVKNNTEPLTAGGEDGWTIEGGKDGYLGPQRDASSLQQGLYGFTSVLGSLAGAEFLPGRYRYAVVGYSENDHDDAYVSKWLTSRVFYGIKNGDQIKFWTKQKWITNAQTAGQLLGLDINSLDCNRANKLEIRLSAGDYSDYTPANVGTTASGVGTFTNLLHTINPDLSVSGYYNDWTQVTVTVSGLPPGKTVNGRFGFRYTFEHGGYKNCRARNNNLPSAVSTTAEVLGNLSTLGVGGSALGNALLAYNSARFLSAVFEKNQKGYNGSYIAIDDFEYISTGVHYVTEHSTIDRVWCGTNVPLERVHMGYSGSSKCKIDGVPTETRFYFVNNSPNPVTIHASTASSLFYSIAMNGNDSIQQISVPAYNSVSIKVSLKDNLSINGMNYDLLYIRQGGSAGPQLYNIKLSHQILPPEPPTTVCSQFPYPVNLNDSGFAKVQNAESYDLGSKPGSCGGLLSFGFSRFSNGFGSNELTFTCADAGIKNFYLVVTNTQTGGRATCPIKAEVIRPGSSPSTVGTVQNFYIDYTGKMPLDSIKIPGSGGVCPITGTPKLIMKGWDRSVNYLNSDGLIPGDYNIEWLVSYTSGSPDTKAVLSELHVIDTIKPIAFCKDTAKIGFNYVRVIGIPGPVKLKLRDDINPFRDIDGGSYDNSGAFITRGITKYSMYSPWYSGALEYFADSFEIECANIGVEFPVTLKVTDASFNSSTCQSYVKIINSSVPECKNTTIALDPVTGIKNITTSDVLANGVGGVCGMTNVSLSKYSFNCNNINQTIPVSVGYTGPDSIVRGCVANVTVKSYSIPEGSCVDTVKHYLTNFSSYTTTIQPVALSACSPALTWALSLPGYNFTNLTGGKNWDFKPGFTSVNRTAIVLNDTFTCNQVYAVYDTSAPVVTSVPTDVIRTIPFLNNNCKYQFEIPNPFQQGTYKEWSYTLSGATTKTVVISTSDYNYSNTYWLNQWDSLNQGVTTVTIKASDFAANETTVTYTITLNVINPFNPSVGYFGASLPAIRGNFCGAVYNHFIESPLIAPCNQTGYMWYYEVRDGYNGNILYEQDSIDQVSGAFVPLRVGAYLNHSYTNVIHFGYHDKMDGHKVYSSNSSASVIDTISAVIVPQNVTIENTNNSTFNYDYTIPTPISYNQSCSGARWGYRITGATNIKSVVNPAITYTPSQTAEFGMTDFSQGYPSLPADSSPVVTLNNGLNTIEYFILEESGVTNLWSNTSYKYNVTIQDVSIPSMSCAANDTLYRSAGPCNVSIADPASQINGFNGPYGKTGFMLLGGNTKVILNKSTAPDSISFINNAGGSVMYKPAFINVVIKTSGTISFNWTYQCNYPQFFRPFAITDTVNPYKAGITYLSGFNQNNTGVQTGTFTKSVVAGEILKIGVYEGGGTSGYLRISAFSAPYIPIKPAISQPTFSDNAAYYFTSNIDTVYPIGSNIITYALANLNNGRTIFCNKTLVVIDSFARNLNCQPKTLYLGAYGDVVLNINDVLPASCFPVSSTILSKNIFTGSDIGTQSVGITSIGTMNDTLTCNFNVTVIDTIKPQPRFWQITLPLESTNTATLTDSMVYAFFYDNHKIVSITKAKSGFGCEDVGSQQVLLTATDSSGNTTSVMATIDVTPGFAPTTERSYTSNVCSNDSLTLTASSTPGYSLNYQWQIKENNDTVKHWNYYSCSDNAPFLDGSDGHQFFSLNKETYVSYYSYSLGTIDFKKLDTITNNWRPALTPIAVNLSSANSYIVNVLPGHVQELEVAMVNNSPRAFGVKVYAPSTNSWITTNDYGFDFFTYQTASPPVNTTDGRNFFFDQLYGDKGLYFPVNNLADVYAVNRDTIGFIRSYYYIRDTVQDWTGQMTIYRKGYDWYTSDPWVPSPAPAPSYVTNGKNVVAIRNTASQNIFFELTFTPNGHISGKDSLTTDPTGGSAIFMLKSFNNNDYIAYKNANGKAAVSKYNGSNTWTNVGGADLSAGDITHIKLGEVNNVLYLVYVETSGRMYIKKSAGNTWVDLGSPNDNINFSSVGSELAIVDLNNAPAIYFTKNTGGTPRLITSSSWRNITNANTATYKPDIGSISTSEFRCVMGNSCGLYSASEINKVIVTPTPIISATTKQYNVVKYGAAQLAVNSNGTNTDWKYGFSDASGILTSGNALTLNSMESDTTVYAYSYNGTCYSDTIKTDIYVYDSAMSIYHISVKDSICVDDYVQISLDTGVVGYKYTLFEKDSNGIYQNTDYSISKTTPWQTITYGVIPAKTTDYKIKIEKLAFDAAEFYTSTPFENHIDFGSDSLPISNEITIEGWVRGVSTSPYNMLGVQYINGSIYDPDSIKNWGWSGSTFDVYNGNHKRSLAFPNLPDPGNWVHVATTAGPYGMKIYYNGTLVASNNDSTSLPVNNNPSSLKLGLRGQYAKVSSMNGFDEFRVWNTVRTGSQIMTTKDACLTGLEPGLVVYNPFSSYDAATQTYPSLKGPDGYYQIYNNSVYSTTTDRNGSCIGDVETYYLPPVTVNVIPNQPVITYADDYFEAPDSVCGGMEVKLVAKASSGYVNWYTSDIGDSVIYTGDTITYFANSSMVLYTAAANSVCRRRETYVDLNSMPEVEIAETDPYCYGSELGDNYFYVSYNGDDYHVYDNPTGGAPLDLNPWSGTGIDAHRILTQTDTLWVEAYNSSWIDESVEKITCISPVRKPLILKVAPKLEITAVKDSSRYGEGSVTLEAHGDSNYVVRWYEIPSGNYAGEGSIFTTPDLTGTTSYKVALHDEDFGCRSDFDTVTATIKQYLTRTDTVLACGSYTWIDNITYTAPDTTVNFVKQSMGSNDSLLVLRLRIINFDQPVVQVNKPNLCIGDSSLITVQTTQAGYHYLLVDSITNNPVGLPVLANGSPLSFNTGALNQNKAYRLMATDTIQIGSKTLSCVQQVASTKYIEVGRLRSTREAATCGSYIWQGQVYAQSGVYFDTVPSTQGCDSILELQLTIFPVKETIDSVVACSSYTWYGTTYYSSTNTPTRFLGATEFGCDSIARLHLTINNNSATDNRLAWDSLTWINGITYTSNNNSAQFTLTNTKGCDSLVTLNLIIINSANRTWESPVAICNGSSYSFNGNNYAATGTYRDTLVSSSGIKDSIIVTQLTVHATYSIPNPQSICTGGVYAFNSKNYTTAGTYRDTLQSVSGCDSIIVTQLTVNPTYSVNNPQTICTGGVYALNSKNYTSAGTYRDTLQSVSGCDSIIVTQLTVNPTYSVNNPQTICSGGVYAFNSKIYTTAGTYRDTLQSVSGCDSIIVTQLTVNPTYSVNNPQTICSGGVYAFNSKNYTTAGTYRDTLQSVSGCDSIIVTQLTVNPAYSVNNPQTICNGGVYAFNSKNYTTAGTYRDTLQSVSGCDSIIVTQLTVNPTYSVNNPQTICNGGVYAFNSKNYTSAGTYRDTLQSVSGCDSIIVTQLTVNPTYSVNNPQTICSGGVYAFNSKNYTTAGTYRDTLQSVSGCDSIIVTQLTVNPTYSVSNPQTICSGAVYAFNSKNYTTAGTYRDTLQSVSGCDSIIVTQLTVNPKPVTSAITGVANAGLNSVESYSVLPTLHSTYQWIITNGTQISGTNTNAISVQWGSSIATSSVEVIETDSNGCKGDTVSQVVTLPVGLLSFNAQQLNTDVLLNWVTTTEVNNKGFEIERSFEGKNFNVIGFTKGNNNSVVKHFYQYVDEDVLAPVKQPQTIFYRLKQIDLDGHFQYSQTVPVNYTVTKNNGLNMIVLPNPFTNAFNLKINSEHAEVATIRIYDAQGKLVMEFEKQINIGESLVPVDQTDSWKTGLYLVTVTINNQTQQVRVLKHE